MVHATSLSRPMPCNNFAVTRALVYCFRDQGRFYGQVKINQELSLLNNNRFNLKALNFNLLFGIFENILIKEVFMRLDYAENL